MIGNGGGELSDMNRKPTGRRALVAEPLFICGVVLAVVNTVWFLVNLTDPVASPVIGRLPALISVALASAAMYRARRNPHLGRPARLFWGTLAPAGVMAASSLVVLIVIDLAGPIPGIDALYMATSLGAMVAVLWALYRLPLGSRNAGDLTRLGLDIATVTISALLLVWYFLIQPTVGRQPTDRELNTALFIILGAVCILAIVKVILAGSRTIDSLALRLLGAGLLVDVVGSAAQPMLDRWPHTDSFQLSSCVIAVFVIAAGLQQWRSPGLAPDIEVTATRRPFSVLPYVAVAAVDTLLLASVQRQVEVRTAVAAGAVLLTAIVVGRQLMAFRDNARLIDQLASHERRFRSLVQSASDVIAILDGTGRTTYVSPGVERLTGLPPAALLGQHRWFTADPDEPTVRDRWAKLVAEPGAKVMYHSTFLHADGDWRSLEVTHTNLLDDPSVEGIVTNLRDITESQEYQQQLFHQASHDPLTELANRSLFGDQLHAAIARSGHSRLSLALVDLDDFKAVNDTLGHQAGDELLVEVAERLRQSVRPNDLVARLGGDEFAILLEHIAPGSVGVAAERILFALVEPITVQGQELLVQASIGVASVLPDDDASSLLRHADLAMYEAKAAGKGRYCEYTASMTAMAAPRAGLAAELRHALHAEQLELHYQPIVTLPAGEVVGVEALVRWRHPDGRLIPPGDFIPIAEQTGLIVPIGQWVLHEACRQAVAWLADPRTAQQGRISVNISARHMRDPSVVAHVAAALRDSGLKPGNLTVEITETAVLGYAAALDAARGLRELGVRIALDDFGTGHSTLSLLQNCPVDQLKLDRSFLPSANATAIAAAVVSVALALGLDVVAEGVENAEQADSLWTLGYRKAQGFYFGRPVPAVSSESSARHSASPPVR